MYLSISVVMLDSQAGQVEGLYSFPEIPFSMLKDSHDYGPSVYHDRNCAHKTI